jgi:uncharacterized protein (TIGR00369 family)
MRHHPLNTPIGRFHVQTPEEGSDRCVATMPVAGLCSPVTGVPSLAALAVLIDHVGGLVNHHRRGAHEWTVSSELTIELTPDAAGVIAASGDVPVRATSRPLGAKAATAVGECHLCIGDVRVGSGTVRSFYIEAPAEYTGSPGDESAMEARHGLAAMMAVGSPHVDGAEVVLPQCSDPVLNNSIGVVHGGIASAGLEIVAAAALNAGRDDAPLATASLRVNFLRPFFAGGGSRYVGTALRVGRRSGVAEAQAIGSDGKVAIISRLTAYRC